MLNLKIRNKSASNSHVSTPRNMQFFINDTEITSGLKSMSIQFGEHGKPVEATIKVYVSGIDVDANVIACLEAYAQSKELPEITREREAREQRMAADVITELVGAGIGEPGGMVVQVYPQAGLRPHTPEDVLPPVEEADVFDYDLSFGASERVNAVRFVERGIAERQGFNIRAHNSLYSYINNSVMMLSNAQPPEELRIIDAGALYFGISYNPHR